MVRVCVSVECQVVVQDGIGFGLGVLFVFGLGSGLRWGCVWGRVRDRVMFGSGVKLQVSVRLGFSWGPVWHLGRSWVTARLRLGL